MTTGDYAGVDAATRGKILEDRAKPPPITDYRGQPGIVRYDAQGNPIYVPAQGTAPDPIKPNVAEVGGTHVETVIDPTTGRAQDLPVPGAPVKPPEIKTVESGGVHYQLVVDPQTGLETAHLIPGQPSTIQKPNTFTGANNETLLAVPDPSVPGGFRAVPMAGAPAPLPPIVNVNPAQPPMERRPEGLVKIPGTPAAPPTPTGAFGGLDTEPGRIDKLITEVSQGVLTDPHYAPTQQQAFEYSVGYNKFYEQPKQTEVRDAETGEVKMIWTAPTPPIGVVHPDKVFERAGLPPQPRPATLPVSSSGSVAIPSPVAAAGAEAPVVGGAPAPAAGAPVTAGGATVQTVIPASKKPKATAEQAKDKVFSSALRNATGVLDQFSANDVPNVLMESLVAPQSKTDQTIWTRWAESQLPSGKDKQYGSAVNLWLSTELYKLSGAAISDGEFARGMRGYVPRAGDTPELIAEKTQRRHDFLKAVFENAYAGDEDAKQKFYRDTVDRGIQLDEQASGGSSAPTPDEAPPKSYTDQGGTPAGWKRVKNKGLWQ